MASSVRADGGFLGEGYDMGMDDLARIAGLGGLPFEMVQANPDAGPDDEDGGEQLDIAGLLREMALAAFSDDPDDFAEYVSENKAVIRAASALPDDGPDVQELLLLGYRFGVSRGSAACMNDLGACYYMGDIVEQDFSKAKEFYEMAVSHGCLQSVVNLGYIYEYGRTGEPDYARAYQCYSLAAALAHSSEAAYKLGDMYARGEFVERDMGRARMLWERSLELAQGVVEQAQPAARLAQLILDGGARDREDGGRGKESSAPGSAPDSTPGGGAPVAGKDALRALALFQTAELGLRLDIADGQTYYRKRLRQSVEGQTRARKLVEEAGDDIM